MELDPHGGDVDFFLLPVLLPLLLQFELLFEFLLGLHHALHLLISLLQLQALAVLLAEQTEPVTSFTALCNEMRWYVTQEAVCVAEAEPVGEVLTAEALRREVSFCEDFVVACRQSRNRQDDPVLVWEVLLLEVDAAVQVERAKVLVQLDEQVLLRRRRDADAEDDLLLQECEDLLVADGLHHLLVHKLAVELGQVVAVADHELVESLLVLQVCVGGVDVAVWVEFLQVEVHRRRRFKFNNDKV